MNNDLIKNKTLKIKEAFVNKDILFNLIVKIVSTDSLSDNFTVLTVGDDSGIMQMILYFNSIDDVKDRLIIGKDYFFTNISIVEELGKAFIVYDYSVSFFIQKDFGVKVNSNDDFSNIPILVE